ncbi:YpiB family protein [Sulfoacidibacillus thermotolerans]|uniref:IDEAL domain protein n=1 Tax=Sulfoacidibacillus thermotolerans TaxID=1765684 RepID=A0A2U3D721_SULT2|nr:YpiB family protein [Sulfoacidibacillus thermotolerans]PWI57061.1 IDEAL domain protein [Sulfoacidibacillus thermotolerans]
MKNVITVADKKHFITWFLEHYELRNPEAEWLLQYLASNDQLLAKVHFTEQFRNSKKSILMSTTCVQMTGFKFYKNKRVTSDVEKAFLDVHTHPDEDVYVTLYYRGRSDCVHYLSVVENLQEAMSKATPTDILIELQVELLLDHIEQTHRKEQLLRAIDEALDRMDRDAFITLSENYRKFLQIVHQ